ncbi:MAG: copper homeostasis protein CutC [Methanococcaceae archaeon]
MQKKKRLIEVCAYSVQSALNASSAGAGRVELCASMPEGGLTPSCAAIKLARRHLDIALNVIIRPRGGDFCYSALELETMQLDIENAKELGADGIVLGILTENGHVDTVRMEKLLKACRPLSVTFHRAFDMTADPLEALEAIIGLGVERILTSGQRQTAFEGRRLIAELVNKASERIIIMPGSGISSANLAELISVTGAAEYHVSAKSAFPGKMTYRNTNVKMSSPNKFNEYEIIESGRAEIDALVKLADNIS